MSIELKMTTLYDLVSKLTLNLAAIETPLSTLVPHRQDGGRREHKPRSQRYAPIHWEFDGVRLGSDWYVICRNQAARADDVDLSGNTAVDLESFSRHAGRSTINPEDVMLLTRRNEGLEQILREELKRFEKARDAKASAK